MIEFLDGDPPPPPVEEDIPAPRRRERMRALWLPFALVVLLVVALLTVHTTPGRRKGPTDVPQPVTVARLTFLNPAQYPGDYVAYPSPTLAREVVRLRGIQGEVDPLLPDGRLPCPSDSACYFSRAMPADVAAALHKAFPLMEPARILTLNTQGINQPLTVWFRQITLVSDTLDVTIRVVRPDRGGLGFSDTIRYGTRTVNYTVVPSDGYAVIVHVESPTGADVRLSVLNMLAIDRRIYTPQA